MPAKRTKKNAPSGSKRRARAAADWLRLQPDAAIDYSDIPELDARFFRTAELLMPVRKVPLSVRLDQDVVAFFRRSGQGYQSRINAVLRAYVAQMQPVKDSGS